MDLSKAFDTLPMIVLSKTLRLRWRLKSYQCRYEFFAPCKGIHDSLGFWIPCCGFRIPKRAEFQFFFRFNAFPRISFSCSNLAVLKDAVRMHNHFVFFFDLSKNGKKVLQFRKGLWYNNEGDIGGLSRPQHRGKK